LYRYFHITNQPPLSSIIKSHRLTFSGYLARMDENADDSQAIFEPPPENRRRPPGQPHITWMKNVHDDLSSLDLGTYEARDLAQNRPLWRLTSLHSATHWQWRMLVLHWTFAMRLKKWDLLRSWMKALNGARPVPGPTITMGRDASVGRRKSGFRLINTGHDSPTDSRSCR